MAQAPRQNPIERAMAEFSAAHNEARFDDAAAHRESARALLDLIPAASTEFPDRVRAVAREYSEAGMTARARSVLQRALDRTAAPGDSHANRIALLGMMADSWREDRNLQRAVAYLEHAAAAQQSASTAYQRLADMYRELGRSEALSATISKIRALPNTREYASLESIEGSRVSIYHGTPLASFFERHGLIEDAVAVYRQDIESAADNYKRASAFQALANLYRRRQHYGDAVETLQRAVAATDSEDLAPLRQSLAIALQQAGRTADADRVYQDLLKAAPDLDSLTSYAAHLSATGRGGQAEELLKQYQANHSGLAADPEHSLLYALANAAVASGARDRSEGYLRAVNGRHLSGDVFWAGEVETKLEKANAATEERNTDKAFSLALHGIEESSTAADIGDTVSIVSMIASALVSKKEADKAEQLYQKLFAVVERRSRDTLAPLLDVTREYAKFLISQPDRWSEVSGAIARYRSLLTEAHGAESGLLEGVIKMSIEFETARKSPRAALAAAQELLLMQESLSGSTSEPYLLAINWVAGVYEMNGDPARALALHRQAVSIADLVYTAADTRRGMVRIEAAFALARQEQFDEAERLAGEAVAIGRAARPAFQEIFSGQVEQIRDMRSAQDLY